MAANTTPIFPGTPKSFSVTFVNSDSTTAKTLYTAGANGSRIDNITVTSNDTAAHDIQFLVTPNAGTAGLVGTISAVIGAGNTSGVGSKIVLQDTNFGWSIFDAYGNRILYLGALAIIQAQMVVAVTAAKTIYINGMAGDF